MSRESWSHSQVGEEEVDDVAARESGKDTLEEDAKAMTDTTEESNVEQESRLKVRPDDLDCRFREERCPHEDVRKKDRKQAGSREGTTATTVESTAERRRGQACGTRTLKTGWRNVGSKTQHP